MNNAEQQKEEFWEKVNHDIRTPLNGITGLLYLMRQNLNNPERLEEYLSKIEAVSEELKYQLESLLDERRIDWHRFQQYEDRVPLSDERQEPVRNEEEPDVISGKRVLVVEDNEINLVIVREILQKWGCEVIWAADGLEAVKIFENSHRKGIDFILMDIRMPYMNGYEATKRIRSMEREDAEKVIIIALTANSYQSEIDKVKEAGMDGIITKPLHVSALRQLMISKYHA